MQENIETITTFQYGRVAGIRCSLPFNAFVDQEIAMLVTYEQGGRVVTVTGWRKWLIVAAVMVVLALILTAIVAVLLGVALTLGIVLLIATPLLCAVALIAWTVRPMWRPKPDRPDA
jgi:hypothetical protein